MIEIGRDDQQPRILLADGEFVEAAEGRRVMAAVEDDDLYQPTHDEQTVDAYLMQSPGPYASWGLHQGSTTVFVVSGLVKIIIFDGRH